MKKLYLFLSKTGTVPSKIIGKVSRARFSHVCLSFDDTFTNMYSFGRKTLKIFPSGFVKENVRKRVLKKYEDCPCAVYSLDVSDEDFALIKQKAEDFERRKEDLKYSCLGIFACWFRLKIRFKNRYFCSQCVSEILQAGNVALPYDPLLMRPMDVLKIEGLKEEFQGAIQNLALQTDKRLANA